jgi:carboxypeptidase C (cathepsin A)
MSSLIGSAALALFAPLLPVQAPPAPAAADAKNEAKPVGPAPEPLHFESRHQLPIAGGKALDYVATAETTPLQDKDGQTEAEFFSIAYAAPGADPATRPVTFAFNGGPGSSSIWLHMGLMGPRLVQVPSDAEGAGAPPFKTIDSPDPILAVSDVVMVDPVGTGFSRVVLKGDPANFWGVDEDAKTVARFIRRWLTDHGRWASPKYILGESYGGIRGPLLVRELQGGANTVALNGLILVSPALDMAVVDGQENDAAFATVIPTFAATAWYHKALPEMPKELDPFLSEVERFVESEYIPALFAGRAMGDDRRADIVSKLHRYTGLSEDYLRRANLKVSSERFRRELLRDRGLVVGRLDTRYTGTEPDAVGEAPSGDPMDAGIGGAYVAAFLDDLRSNLGVKVDREYVVMSGEAGKSWKRPKQDDSAFQGYVNVAPDLARGLADNPQLRVLIVNGLFDVACTFYASEYEVQRSTMDLKRVELRRFPAGHMMYVHHPTELALSKAIKEFIAPNPAGF